MSATRRVDLGSGAWADIYTVRTHSMVRAVEAALIRLGPALTSKDGQAAFIEVPTDYIAESIIALTANWSVPSPLTGEPLPLSPEGIGEAPEEIVQALYDHCMAQYKGLEAKDAVPQA